MIRISLAVVVLAVCCGGRCEEDRLAACDEGSMTTPAGLPMIPTVPPWTVVVDPEGMPDLATLYSVSEYLADTLGEDWVSWEISTERYAALDAVDPEERDGLILVSVGSVPDAGGAADLWWYCRESGVCIITTCEVMIDHEHAYDAETLRARLLHELGHCWGLAHDCDSVDLGSCMSSPPPVGCSYTDHDADIITDAWWL